MTLSLIFEVEESLSKNAVAERDGKGLAKSRTASPASTALVCVPPRLRVLALIIVVRFLSGAVFG